MRTAFKRAGAEYAIPKVDHAELVNPQGRVYQSDAVKLVELLPDKSVDLVVFDPAYESLEKWRKLGTTTRLKQSKSSSNPWFETFPNKRYPALFRQLKRVMKPGTHLYMFADAETRDLVCTGYSPQTGEELCHMISPAGHRFRWSLAEAGLKYWKSLIFDKEVGGMGYHYRAQHEFIIFAEKVLRKGKHRRLNSPKPTDVLRYKRLKGKQYYPTEKPYELIKLLIEQSSNEGDTVLDPFCGSGVVGQVCQDTGRKYVLGDLNIEEAVKRLSAKE